MPTPQENAMPDLSLVDTQTGEITAPTFDDFYLLFPRHQAKKDGLKAWSRLTEEQKVKAVVACADWRRIWSSMDQQYIPLPASWLRGERWDDEPPLEYRQSAQAHKPAQMPENSPRTVIPEHVRQLLAKMRGK